MTIASADLLPILDSLGIMYDDLLALAATTEGTAINTGAGNNATRILALTDISQVKDLATGFDALKTSAASPYSTPSELFAPALSAIQRHVNGLNAFLTTNSAKVSRSFADLWRSIYGASSISAANVFQEPAVVLASWTYTGAGTGTFSGTGGPLDMTLVAPSQLELIITADIGASGVVSLTCVKSDNNTEVKTVNVGTSDDVGDTLDVGTGTDVYKDVSLITSTGGTSGAFDVRNKLPRTPVI